MFDDVSVGGRLLWNDFGWGIDYGVRNLRHLPFNLKFDWLIHYVDLTHP